MRNQNYKLNKSWNGTFKNERIPDGVYTYKIEFQILDGPTLKKNWESYYTILNL